MWFSLWQFKVLCFTKPQRRKITLCNLRLWSTSNWSIEKLQNNWKGQNTAKMIHVFISYLIANNHLRMKTTCSTWGCPHYASIILSIIVRQKNQALCWNNSAKFLRLLMLLRNFAKPMGFPHKTPAQVAYFNMRPGYKLAKTSLPAVPVLQHCQLPLRTVSIYTSYQQKRGLHL